MDEIIHSWLPRFTTGYFHDQDVLSKSAQRRKKFISLCVELTSREIIFYFLEIVFLTI